MANPLFESSSDQRSARQIPSVEDLVSPQMDKSLGQQFLGGMMKEIPAGFASLGSAIVGGATGGKAGFYDGWNRGGEQYRTNQTRQDAIKASTLEKLYGNDDLMEAYAEARAKAADDPSKFNTYLSDALQRSSQKTGSMSYVDLMVAAEGGDLKNAAKRVEDSYNTRASIPANIAAATNRAATVEDKKVETEIRDSKGKALGTKVEKTSTAKEKDMGGKGKAKEPVNVLRYNPKTRNFE